MSAEELIEELTRMIDLIRQEGKDWLDERDIPVLQSAIDSIEAWITVGRLLGIVDKDGVK